MSVTILILNYLRIYSKINNYIKIAAESSRQYDDCVD